MGKGWTLPGALTNLLYLGSLKEGRINVSWYLKGDEELITLAEEGSEKAAVNSPYISLSSARAPLPDWVGVSASTSQKERG